MEPKHFFHFALAVVIVATEVNADLSAEKLITTGIDIIQSINDPKELFTIMFTFFKDLSAPDSSGPNDYTDMKLESISESLNEISADIQEFKENLFDKISAEKDLKDIAEKMGKIFRYKFYIDNLFIDFQNFHNSSITKEGDYLSSTKEEFIQKIRKYLNEKLRDMKYQLIQVSDVWSRGAAWQLSESSLTSELVCSRHRPQQLIIYNIYLAYCATEIKALALNVYAVQHSTKAENREDSRHVADFRTIRNDFIERLKEVTLVFKQAMKRSSRSHWSCEDPRKDVNYLKFGPFLQKYIAQEQEILPISGTGSGHACTGDCERHELGMTYRKPSRGGCGYQLRNCQTFDQDINVCKGEPDSGHKYEYVKTSDGSVYGKLENCHRDLLNWYRTTNWFLYYNQCELCLCTCEEIDKAANHTIDLTMVEAAAINNEVIVGLRFGMENGLLFIEPRTAKLLPSGMIDTESQIWKRKNAEWDVINNPKEYRIGVDCVILSWSNRSFVLDDVELGNDYVLTGVKFVYENGFIKLAARGHKFDFKNGTIDSTEEIWVESGKSKPQSEYSELSVANLTVPTDYNDNKIDSYNGGVKNENIVQFVTLTTSSMKSDVGQNVVPFIDVKPVVPKQLTPLSGVGLVHKGTRKSAGYLALKIIGYDFEPHVGEESI